jgi:CDP-diacylglycerol pyrophosphatase
MERALLCLAIGAVMNKTMRSPAALAAISAGAAFMLVAVCAAQTGLPPNALWEVVRNVCVPGQSQHQDPKPCLQVDLTGGTEKGFAILRDPRRAVQFLLIPTARISGIESPAVLAPNATNYFAQAWEARTYIDQALQRPLPRDGIGLAINSSVSRSQDQLHIHFACVRADVMNALRNNGGKIERRWSPFAVPLRWRRHYAAMWLPGEHLGANNPFQLLASSLPGASAAMGNYTLVVVGMTRPDGTKGFVLLADHVDKQQDNSAGGEELLDASCRIAAQQR